jgi:hypothetical protein
VEIGQAFVSGAPTLMRRPAARLTFRTMSERRYSDSEIAEIFQRATEAPHPQRSALVSSEGMTLAELQEIGREAGIAPESVAQAARSLTLSPQPTLRRFLGLPIAVGRSMDLDRKITDAEWEQIVVDLRQTFDARGRVREEGSFRQWTNGNLQALVEPTPTGNRLRLKTLNANARTLMLAGVAMAGVGAATVVGALAGGTGIALDSAIQIGTIGAALFAVGAIRLPRWARLRQRQMEEVIARVAAPPQLGKPGG